MGTPLSERIIYVQKSGAKKENAKIGIPESRTQADFRYRGILVGTCKMVDSPTVQRDGGVARGPGGPPNKR